MYRNITLSALLAFAFLAFSSSAAADSIGVGEPSSTTSSTTVTTDDSIGVGNDSSWWEDLLIGG